MVLSETPLTLKLEESVSNLSHQGWWVVSGLGRWAGPRSSPKSDSICSANSAGKPAFLTEHSASCLLCLLSPEPTPPLKLTLLS